MAPVLDGMSITSCRFRRRLLHAAHSSPPRMSHDDRGALARQLTILQLPTDHGQKAGGCSPFRVLLQYEAALGELLAIAPEQGRALVKQEHGLFAETAPFVEQLHAHDWLEE